MWRLIAKNKLLSLCSAITAVSAASVVLWIVVDKPFIRPYVSECSAQVFDQKHVPLFIADQTRFIQDEKKIQLLEEIAIDMHYNQKAMMTKAQTDKAYDIKSADTTFRKLLSGGR